VQDQAGFREFVVARQRAMLKLAWILVGDWQQAEDLVQTALMKCYPKWDQLKSGNPEGYVRRAIVSVYASSRLRRWHGEIPTERPPTGAETVDGLSAVDLRRTLVAALAQLPRRQRAAVVLRHYEDLSETEAAEILGCSVGTVKSLTARGLAQLRRNGLLLAEGGLQEVHDAER
jgi:RNA polymerase sigma-70 factor (sigma-E family)